MPSGEYLVIPVTPGFDARQRVALTDIYGGVVTTYTNAAILSVRVWSGEDLAPVSADELPTAEWVTDGSDGLVELYFPAAFTEELTGGRWGVQLRIQADDDVARQIAWLEVADTPGAATPGKTYATRKDLLNVAPWVEQCQASSDLTGFADALHEATMQLDHVLQRHYTGTGENRQTSMDHMLDGGSFRSGAHDRTLQAWLDDNRLVLTTPDGRLLKRWVALMAAWMIGRREIGDAGADYREFAARCKREADAILPCVTAEIDTTTTADGVGDVFISLATHDTLRG